MSRRQARARVVVGVSSIAAAAGLLWWAAGLVVAVAGLLLFEVGLAQTTVGIDSERSLRP